MIKKILIANRGEIAVRAIRTCREMGIETVAVYTEADKESLHVAYADKAICIGPGPVQTGYLYVYNILAAATTASVDAIYPGSGFFAENAVFVEKYVENARHVEVQVLADSFGNVHHLFDRDCTMQRRNQKLIMLI